MKNYLLSTALFATLLLAPIQSRAEEHKMPHPHGEKMFQKMDTNGDGTISQDEWTAHHGSKFAEIDANKDGKLSKEELKAHHEKHKKERHEKMEKMKEHHEKKVHGEGKPEDKPEAEGEKAE